MNVTTQTLPLKLESGVCFPEGSTNVKSGAFLDAGADWENAAETVAAATRARLASVRMLPVYLSPSTDSTVAPTHLSLNFPESPLPVNTSGPVLSTCIFFHRPFITR